MRQFLWSWWYFRELIIWVESRIGPGVGPWYCTTARKISVQNSINRVCLYACHCVCVFKRVCVCLLRLRNLSRLNSLFTKVLQHITHNREYFASTCNSRGTQFQDAEMRNYTAGVTYLMSYWVSGRTKKMREEVVFFELLSIWNEIKALSRRGRGFGRGLAKLREGKILDIFRKTANHHWK